MKQRPNMKVLYELQPNEDYKIINGKIVVVHPERPPKIVHSDGIIEELECMA